MLKSQSSEDSGCTNMNQISEKKVLNKQMSARRLLTTVFCCGKGVLMVKFMQHGTIIMSEMYCETLQKYMRPFRKKA
jgi:hypothetical protein